MADLAPPSPEFGPPVTSVPSLGERLPAYARSPEEQALELPQVQRLEAQLAAHELELVAAFAADRPASADRQPGEPGAAAGDDAVPGTGAPGGVSESFPDELALTLNCARATATTLTASSSGHLNQHPACTHRHPTRPTTRHRSDPTHPSPAAVTHPAAGRAGTTRVRQ